VFGRCYGLETIGLRYFNVFGPRQDPKGPYAAVIPRWIAAIKKGGPVLIYGDGKTSRDFTYVDNAVQANLLAGLTKNKKAVHEIYNVACGTRTSLNKLFLIIANFYHRTPHPAPSTQHLAPRTQHPVPSTKNKSRQHAVGRGQLETRNRVLPTAYRLQKRIPFAKIVYLKFRAGDIRHSLADTLKASKQFGYLPSAHIGEGTINLCATEAKGN
jgi:UDP-N-acetylglucosamine 4-epimerase